MCGIAQLGNRALRAAIYVSLAVLLRVPAANAQLDLGENLKMHLGGNLGYAYSGLFGDPMQSSHGQGFAGDAALTGYYFHPNFISFDIRPYYDRSQSNADSQLIERGTGVTGYVKLFGGSRFPGSISFSKTFDSNSQFSVAGVPSLDANSSGQQFAISWSELVPNLPPVSATYSVSDVSSSLQGTTGKSNSFSQTFSLDSNYRLGGFDLRGNFLHQDISFTTPQLLLPESITVESAGTSYGLSVGHKLPLSGSLGMNVAHFTSSYNGGGASSSNNYSANATVAPMRRLSLYSSVNYVTNLTEALSQSVLGGNAPAFLLRDSGSKSISFGSGATWTVGHGLAVSGNFTHRQQSFNNGEYSDSQFGGTVSYRKQNRFLGFMYFGVGLVDTANKYGNTGTGLVGNVGMNRKFGHWDTSADFSYTQYLQTITILAATSSYNYGGSVRRKINRETYWNLSFRGSHSGLVTQTGSGNRAESFSTAFSRKRYSFTGTYSQSSGSAVLTATGALVATDLGGLITDNVVYFNAHSYGVTASTHWRRLVVSGSYANVFSETSQHSLNTVGSGDRYFAHLHYRMRKMSLGGTLSRSTQDVSTILGGPRVVNSYYLSVARWFNVF